MVVFLVPLMKWTALEIIIGASVKAIESTRRVLRLKEDECQ